MIPLPTLRRGLIPSDFKINIACSIESECMLLMITALSALVNHRSSSLGFVYILFLTNPRDFIPKKFTVSVIILFHSTFLFID